mgnify:CR=1 FL=1
MPAIPFHVVFHAVLAVVSYQLTFFSDRHIGFGVLCCLLLCAYAAGAIVSSDASTYIAEVHAFVLETLALLAGQLGQLVARWY